MLQGSHNETDAPDLEAMEHVAIIAPYRNHCSSTIIIITSWAHELTYPLYCFWFIKIYIFCSCDLQYIMIMCNISYMIYDYYHQYRNRSLQLHNFLNFMKNFLRRNILQKSKQLRLRCFWRISLKNFHAKLSPKKYSSEK